MGKGDGHDDAKSLGVADEHGVGAEPGAGRRVPNLGPRSRHDAAVGSLSEASAAIHSAVAGLPAHQGTREPGRSGGQAESGSAGPVSDRSLGANCRRRRAPKTKRALISVRLVAHTFLMKCYGARVVFAFFHCEFSLG